MGFGTDKYGDLDPGTIASDLCHIWMRGEIVNDILNSNQPSTDPNPSARVDSTYERGPSDPPPPKTYSYARPPQYISSKITNLGCMSIVVALTCPVAAVISYSRGDVILFVAFCSVTVLLSLLAARSKPSVSNDIYVRTDIPRYSSKMRFSPIQPLMYLLMIIVPPIIGGWFFFPLGLIVGTIVSIFAGAFIIFTESNYS